MTTGSSRPQGGITITPIVWFTFAALMLAGAIAWDFYAETSNISDLLYVGAVFTTSLAGAAGPTLVAACVCALTFIAANLTGVHAPGGAFFGLGWVLPLSAMGAIAWFTRQREKQFERVRKAEKRFEKVFQSAIDSTAILNDRGEFLDGNDATLQLFGLDSFEQLRGLSPEDLSPEIQPDGTPSAGQAQQMFAKVLENGYHRFEWTLNRPGGGTIDCEISLGAIEVDGEPCFLGTCRDITEPKRARTRRREAQEELQAIYDAIGDTILMADAETHRFVHVNDAACDMLGYSREEFLELTIEDIHPPESLEEIAGYVERARGGEFLQVPELPYLRKDGSVFFADVQGNRLTFAGKAHLFAMVRDVSERRAAEQNLRIARHAIDTATVGIAMADLEETIFYANPAWAQMMGASNPEEVLGTTPHSWGRDPTVMDEMLQAIRTRGGWVGELPLKRMDGSPFEVSLSANLVYDEHRNPLCLMGSFVDLTDMKEAERERLELERRLMDAARMESLGFLAGGVAHDFNNLLGSMLVNVSSLQQKLEDEKQLEKLKQVETAIASASNLCSQLLTYAGARKSPRKSLCLYELLQDLGSLLRSSVSHKIELQIEDHNGSRDVRGDSAQIQQIVLNLITNAADAIGDNTGTISVCIDEADLYEDDLQTMTLGEWAKPGKYQCLSVRDTGPGMEPELIQKVFDPFFSTKFPGRGLGLSTVRGVIKSHGGALRVTSKPGEGTTFEAFLPAALQPTQRPSPARAAQSPEGESRHGSRILVVDDEPDLRAIIAETLGEFGYSVTAAEDGRAALEILDQQSTDFDLVVLDLTMPHVSGGDVLQHIRSLAPSLPVILMTGYAAADVAAKGELFAGVPVLEKPFTVSRLLSQVEVLLPASTPGASAQGR